MADITSQLGTDSIKKLMLRLSIPTITAQLINALYNVVDRIFIGHIPGIGSYALAGIGLAFPIILLVSAFSSLIGMGGAPLASIRLGRGDREGAERLMGNCVTALLVISAVLTTVFFIYRRPLLMLFGASENTIEYAQSYLGIYLLGTVFVQLSLGLNSFINSQGFTKISMATVTIGAVMNIVLDAVFINVFHWGVEGAALATITSQAVSAIWVLAFLCGKKTVLKIHLKNLLPRPSLILPVLGLGLSPFVMQATESLLNIVLNSSLQHYGGDDAVFAMSLFSSVMQMSIMPLQGLTQGAQPITSYNYGARQFGRVRETFRLLLKCSLTFTTVLWLLIMLLPEVFCGFFTSDTTRIAWCAPYLRIYMGGILCMGAQIACQQTFLALGQAKISLFLALFRKVILLIPLIYLLAPHFGITGIFAAEPISDVTASLVTFGCFTYYTRKVLFYSHTHAGSDDVIHT